MDQPILSHLMTRLIQAGDAAHESRLNGANFISEAARMRHLQANDVVNQREALGTRLLQGPHPYYGSPDAPKTQ